MAIVGAVAGAILVLPLGTTALILWVLVSGVVLEHLFPWDIALEERSRLPAWILELIIYAYVGGLLLAIALKGGGAGLSDVAPAAAVYLTVVLARGLFEARVLYGGADAKALMVAGILVPFFPHPVLSLPTSATFDPLRAAVRGHGGRGRRPPLDRGPDLPRAPERRPEESSSSLGASPVSGSAVAELQTVRLAPGPHLSLPGPQARGGRGGDLRGGPRAPSAPGRATEGAGGRTGMGHSAAAVPRVPRPRGRCGSPGREPPRRHSRPALIALVPSTNKAFGPLPLDPVGDGEGFEDIPDPGPNRQTRVRRPRSRGEDRRAGPAGRGHGGDLRRTSPDPRGDRRIAIEEDVDLIGVSILSGAHMALFPGSCKLLQGSKGLGHPRVRRRYHPRRGCASTEEDRDRAIFGPGTSLEEIVTTARTIARHLA